MGKLKEVPGVFSQGETLDELSQNIDDAYHMMIESDLQPAHEEVHTPEDTSYHLHVVEKVRRGIERAETEGVFTREEVMDRLGKWIL